MRLLGEDKEFDQLMLTNSAVKSALKTKGSSRSKSNAQHLKELVRILFSLAQSNRMKLNFEKRRTERGLRIRDV